MPLYVRLTMCNVAMNINKYKQTRNDGMCNVKVKTELMMIAFIITFGEILLLRFELSRLFVSGDYKHYSNLHTETTHAYAMKKIKITSDYINQS